MIHGMIKYLGSTNGAVTTDNAVVMSQTSTKLIRTGPVECLVVSDTGRAWSVDLETCESSLECARDCMLSQKQM